MPIGKWLRPTAEAGQRSKRTSPIQPCACPGWAAARIEERHYDLLASFSERLVVEIKGIGEVPFCHTTPRGDEEILTAATPDDWLREILYEVDQDQIVCGHLHIQYNRRLDGKRVINAGSVGMPYQSESVGAFWLLLDRNVKFRRLDAAATTSGAPLASSAPQATWRPETQRRFSWSHLTQSG